MDNILNCTDEKSSSLQMQMHEYQKLKMGAQGSSTLDLNWNSTRNCPAQSAVQTLQEEPN